jgi:hypothetical protein
MSESIAWWGALEVPVGECRRWVIGPASVIAARVPGEWHIVIERSDDPQDGSLAVAEPYSPNGDLIEHPRVQRFGVSGDEDDDTLYLGPRTADRSIVARPVSPFSVPPEEHVRVWLGSPLWLHIAIGAQRRLLMDVPLYPPSNTWFGSSPAQGELCYASRSVFRARFQDVLLRPHRAVTTLHIHNRAAEPLALERVNVPVTYLPLYATPDGGLWTPEVTLTHRSGDELAPLEIDKGAPDHAEGARLLTEPRQRPAENTLVRAFSSLFAQ